MGNASAQEAETDSVAQVSHGVIAEKTQTSKEGPEAFQAERYYVRGLREMDGAPVEPMSDEHPSALKFEPAMHCFRSQNLSSAPHARILAYGDSLTAGCHTRDSYGAKEFAPFGQYVVETLAPDVVVELWVCGLSGATAADLADAYESKSIIDAVGREGFGIESALALHGPFDLVLIMLGTHDLANAQQSRFPTPNLAHKVFKHIERIHSVCHACNTHTVALSVPESRPYRLGLENNMYADYVDCWSQLNASLQTWSAKNRGRVKLCINNSEAMPFSSGSDYWESDGFHFSAAGSYHFGSRIAEALVSSIKEISWRKKLDAKACNMVTETVICLKKKKKTARSPNPCQKRRESIDNHGSASRAGEVKLDHGEVVGIDYTKASSHISSSVVRGATQPDETFNMAAARYSGAKAVDCSDFEFWRPPLDTWTELPDPEPI